MSEEFDFAVAFQQGQRAAEQAQAARKEISSVIENLSKSISSATDGKLEVTIRDFEDTLPGIVGLIQMASDPTKAMSKSKWISARNATTTPERWVRLARWSRPESGYPCTIQYGEKEVGCHDRSGLESAIAEMLADGSIGQRLRSLLAQ